MVVGQPKIARHAGCDIGPIAALQWVEHGGCMTERVVPYWVGNVARVHFPPKAFHMTPDPMVPAYGQSAAQPHSAKVIQLTQPTKK